MRESFGGVKFETWGSLNVLSPVLRTPAETIGNTIRALNTALDPAIANVLCYVTVIS